MTLEGKIELLPVIFLGLAHDTIGYLAEAGAPVKTLADLQAYNAAKPEIRIPRGQNMIELDSQVMAAFYKEDGLKEDGLAKAYEGLTLKAREWTATGKFPASVFRIMLSHWLFLQGSS